MQILPFRTTDRRTDKQQGDKLDSRFLADVKLLLQQLDQAQLDSDIRLGTFIDGLQDICFNFDGEVLTGLRWVGRDLEGFELDRVGGETLSLA